MMWSFISKKFRYIRDIILYKLIQSYLKIIMGDIYTSDTKKIDCTIPVQLTTVLVY